MWNCRLTFCCTFTFKWTNKSIKIYCWVKCCSQSSLFLSFVFPVYFFLYWSAHWLNIWRSTTGALSLCFIWFLLNSQPLCLPINILNKSNFLHVRDGWGQTLHARPCAAIKLLWVHWLLRLLTNKVEACFMHRMRVLFIQNPCFYLFMKDRAPSFNFTNKGICAS